MIEELPGTSNARRVEVQDSPNAEHSADHMARVPAAPLVLRSPTSITISPAVAGRKIRIYRTQLGSLSDQGIYERF
jgi:hypothetical protein